jgi:hypothetical protein
MLETPELIETLRPLRTSVQAALVAAELSERREPAGDRPPAWVEREELWAEWQDLRCLRRPTMTARQKAYVIGRFGAALYRSLRS